jgi:hypothetical protein
MSTVTPADTARHLRLRTAADEARGHERERRLRGQLANAAACLRSNYGVQRIVLFGSIASSTCHADSDIAAADET